MKQIDLFSAMAEMRYFDEACLEGVPTMEILGELHTGIGQEAISAGMFGLLKKEDALVSTHRNHYHALIHSIIDSLLGAISKRDIGYHFPSSKSEFKNISSFILLKEVIKKLSGENYKILNIDSTIILESPPISKFIDSMVEAISNEVGLN